MKKVLFVAFTLLSACTTAPISTTPEPKTMPTPGGYIQFCQDFPESVLCE